MRTSNSAPVPSLYSSAATLYRDATVNTRPELIVLARIAADLMDWLDCSWIVGLTSGERDLRVVCLMGSPPDLPRCIEWVAQTVRVSGAALCVETNARDVGIRRGDAVSAIPVLVSRIPNHHGSAPLLAIGPKNGGMPYSDRDRDLVCDLCQSIGAVLSNARLARAISAEVVASDRIRADFEAAQDLQERFLPSGVTPIQGLEYHGSSQRCGTLGGDFFGFLHPCATQLVMTLGRVAPVGSAAAVLAAGLQATLRTLLDYEADLTRVLHKLNLMMWEVSPGDIFSTLLCVRIDPSARTLEYASAGQEAAFLIHAGDCRVTPLQNSGAVLGLSRRSTYVKRTIALHPGDVLVALTDGIADATMSGNLSFIQALPKLLGDLSNTPAPDLVGFVLKAVENFSGRPAEIADRTITVIRMNSYAKYRFGDRNSAHSCARAVAA